MALRKCQVCNVALKVENVERHITAVHPREDVSSVLSEEERRSVRRSSRRARPARRGVRLNRSAVAAAIVVALVLGGLAYGVSRLPPPTQLFRIWGQSFDAQQVLGHPAGAGHRVRMVVDGAEQAPTYSLVF